MNRLFAVFLVLACGAAEANRVEYQFTGNVTSVDVIFSDTGLYPNQSVVTGNFIYDTGWPSAGNSFLYSPSGSNYGITINYGGETFSSVPELSASEHIIDVANDRVINPVRDQFTYNAAVSDGYGFGLYFTTTDSTFLIDNSIPPTLDLNTFDSERIGRLQLFENNQELALVEFEITSLTAIPIPAAVWLFASGLGLLGEVRRRQRLIA